MNAATALHALDDDTQKCARRIIICGRVQGVGYRPFVYRIAHELGIFGSVFNGSGRVFIQAEGTQQSLDEFLILLIDKAPPLAEPHIESVEDFSSTEQRAFHIEASGSAGAADIHVPPDLFTCDDCVAELNDNDERRHDYAFINCTQCGPRYTIITAMPYDRVNTSMQAFKLCGACQREYEDPADRRFHAQPLACPACGPALEFTNPKLHVYEKDAALATAIRAIRLGAIVAVKGVGGYHLVCDARNSATVQQLRQRKNRPHKPLAVMFPISGEDGLATVRQYVEPSEEEAQQIINPSRPIVLVRKRSNTAMPAMLAPGLDELGVFLPYSPLHHLLLREFGHPLVATSGNISGEPVITDNGEAAIRLDAVADAFLHHNRPIVRPADDAVVRVIAGKTTPIRPGRGSAPIELALATSIDIPTIAVGGHMKSSVALAWNRRAIVSPHIGDLDSPRSMQVFRRVIADLQELYGVRARRLICDLHPGYASTRWALQQELPSLRVQHHRAHASALYGEQAGTDPWLVFTWDGVGYGDDRTFWGGEALLGQPGDWRRVASIRPLRLVGGDRAGREPWRSAAAMAWATNSDWMPAIKGIDVAARAWRRNINTYQSTAVGRMFDAAATYILDRHYASFEGQGPMELESIANSDAASIAMPIQTNEQGLMISDWEPLLAVIADPTLSRRERAGVFHASMAQVIVDQALKIRERHHIDTVGLSGGVFQNRKLCELASTTLIARGFDVRTHQRVPANDGGLCFGQLNEVAASDER